MSYEEWLNNIDILREKDNKEIKDKLLIEDVNDNIKFLLEPKIVELINYKFKKLTNKISSNLNELYSDYNILDMHLVNIKKSLKFIIELTYINVISKDKQLEIRASLKKEIEYMYKILIDGADKIDSIGIFSQTIKNNMYKMEG